MSISEELNKLIETKEAIRQSIIAKGTDVGTDVPFSQYPSKIDEIQSGSGEEYMHPEFFELITNGGTDFSYLFSQRYLGGALGKPADFSFLHGWDTSNVTNMSYMFYLTSRNIEIDSPLELNNWDTSNVTNMSNMFNGCSFKNINCNGWDTSNVTGITGMFNDSYVRTVDLSNWDISNCKSIEDVFCDCKYLTNLDLSSWINTSNLVNASGAFSGCSALVTLNLNNWDTSNITSFGSIYWFIGAVSGKMQIEEIIGEIDLSSCNGGLTYSSSYYMFKYCNSLKQVKLKNIYKNATITNVTKWSINLGDTIIEDEYLIYIINELPDLINDKGLTATDKIILTLPPTNTLTAEQVQAAIDKGWNVANTTF